MLVVLSPAKRLDWSERPGVETEVPALSADATVLAAAARQLSVPQLRRLMGISEDLARLNRDRFAAFQPDPQPDATRPAVFAFAGDTYAGLEAGSLSDDALRWADTHLRILSGLYGVLRPRDAIQPYRLEMGSRLETARGRSLYDYWGPRLAECLNAEADAAGTGWLLNCASVEYFGAVDPAALRLRVLTPVFLEDRGGESKIVSFWAKKARGAMARFVMENRIADPAGLRDFDAGGYRFDAADSTEARLVFRRSEAERLAS